MKKRKLFILFIVLFMLFFTSCKKVTKCKIKKYDDFYIAEKYLENKKYLDYLNDKLDTSDQMELISMKIFSKKTDCLLILHNGGHLANVKNITFDSFYNVMSENCKDMMLSEWCFYFGGSHYYTNDIFSYAIMYGEPTVEGNALCYKNLEYNSGVYFAGINPDLDIEELKTYYLPDNTTYVLSFSLVVNPNIKELICNKELKYIGHTAFIGNSNLKRIIFNDGLECIGRRAFIECQLDYVIIPESVIDIDTEAFNSGNIFCESESKPVGWDKDWAIKDAKVYWKGEWEYNSEGIPVPISE